MLRKPDRFERMVNRVGFVEAWRGDRKIYEADALKLLRRQHRAYVRMVKDEYTHWSTISSDKSRSPGLITYAHYRAVQCRAISTLLEDYKC